MNINHTLESIAPYASKRISQMAKADPHFVSLSIGEPWFGPAPAVTEILQDLAFKDLRLTKYSLSHYADGRGDYGLREAVAKRYQRLSGTAVDPDRNIMITHGGSQAFMLALLAVTNPGEEVIVPDPTYMLYANTCKLLGRIPIRPRKCAEEGFILSPETLCSALSARTRLLVINSPENPTGAVYSESELRALYDVCVQNGVILLQDEVYDSFVLEGKHISCTTFNPSLESCLQLNSMSKRYGLPGLRIGWLIANERLIANAAKALDYVALSVSGLSSYVAEAILSDPSVDAWIDTTRMEVMSNRDLLVTSLAPLGFSFPPRSGAGGFFLFPNVKALVARLRITGGSTAGDAFAEWIARKAKIAVVPGSVYGDQGSDHIRIVTTPELSDLQMAIRRFNESLT